MSKPPTLYAPKIATSALQAREAAGLPWLFNGGTVSGDLPDINVWLALAVQDHPHHATAKQYWDSVQARPLPERNIWFCRTTMLGLVRLLSQPKVMGKDALNAPQAFALYTQFRAVAGVDLLTEPRSCDTILQNLLSSRSTHIPQPNRLWTDAYLAAVAQSSGTHLVTFDPDFVRFDLENCLILQTV